MRLISKPIAWMKACFYFAVGLDAFDWLGIILFLLILFVLI